MINKNFIIIMCLLIQFNFHYCYAVEPDEILKNSRQEERARNISKNIRCMVCQNQSIDESSAPLAKDLRILIREQIKDKKKDDEIYKFLTDRYGDYILLKPPFKSNTLALWLLPLIFCTIGLFIIIINNKKSKKLIKNI
jgi:cytochrome c-type biogenesis protein CcmH